jgi:hypothetical protein
MLYSMLCTMLRMLWEVPATLASAPDNDHVASIYMYLHIATLAAAHAFLAVMISK